MDEKLKELLTKINLDSDYYHYFNDSKFKVIVNTKKNIWTFNIDIDQILPVHIYTYIKESLCSLFSHIEKLENCNILIGAKEIDYNLVKDYWSYTLERLKTVSPTINMFESNVITIDNNKVKIEVDNKAESNKIIKLKSKIEELYKYYGFKDIEITTYINEEKRDLIKAAINKSKEIKIETKAKSEDNILYGDLIKGKTLDISEIEIEENNVIIEGYIFGTEYFESSKSDFKIITLKVTDYKDSIYVKVFTRDANEFSELKGKLKDGIWIKVRGYTKNDLYAKDLVLNARDINKLPPQEEIRDEALVKRVELHTHTFMSQMDSVVSAKDLIKRAKRWGHRAIAITDHNSLQAFPEAYANEDGIKVIYGAELTIVDDNIDVVFRENNSKLEDNTYVVFDFETTGLNAGSGDSIIEVGAVKLKNGKIIDKFSKLIDPKVTLPQIITDITGITEDMLKGKPSEEVEILEFYKGGSVPRFSPFLVPMMIPDMASG
ncbi:MAG: PHP domain-containing protein, partial [Bacilli bacterium]|nr:PHP domain-containing protein [Bacilli bacterium]